MLLKLWGWSRSELVFKSASVGVVRVLRGAVFCDGADTLVMIVAVRVIMTSASIQ